MPIVHLRIPQMGEGLQEARVVAFLKKPGDRVRRDEPIYQMETDKAVLDIESPYEGTLVDWLVKEGDVLPIGTEVGRMEVEEAVEEMPAGHEPPSRAVRESPAVALTEQEVENVPRGSVAIPPRTRRYLKEKGLLEVAHLIPAKGSKLTPEDVDAYLLTRERQEVVPARVTEEYEELEISSRQRTLSYRLVRGAQLCVPGTIMVYADWSAIESAREFLRERGGEFQPSAFTMMAWCVVQAMKDHPKFRSTLPREGVLRVYKHVNLGIAVALPDDELVTAVVPQADTLSWREFAETTRRQIDLARQGQDQATEATTLSITNMSAYGLRSAIPVVVSPAVGTLFLGEPFWEAVPVMGGHEIRRFVVLSLTFDHRIVNGVGAANFLNDVKRRIEEFILPEE
ncbi:MAG: 2-oxo acid dehydrogenase subunit E2 [Fimbriimonadales bacterium]|nr:2-oxo acid dehydrogenase subunit E2 [Fimbriimonadales bacterium]